MTIIHAYAHAVLRDLARRFSGTSIVNDGLVAFAVDLQLSSKEAAPPKAALQRLAKFCKQEETDFAIAW
eukprot:9689393-Karenia_brevis.AAC.1